MSITLEPGVSGCMRPQREHWSLSGQENQRTEVEKTEATEENGKGRIRSGIPSFIYFNCIAASL
jgi:hypothetical protein